MLQIGCQSPPFRLRWLKIVRRAGVGEKPTLEWRGRRFTITYETATPYNPHWHHLYHMMDFHSLCFLKEAKFTQIHAFQALFLMHGECTSDASRLPCCHTSAVLYVLFHISPSTWCLFFLPSSSFFPFTSGSYTLPFCSVACFVE